MSVVCVHCDGEVTGYMHLKCHVCSGTWHTDCASLTGITKGTLDKILQWRCPSCIITASGDPMLQILTRISKMERDIVTIFNRLPEPKVTPEPADRLQEESVGQENTVNSDITASLHESDVNRAVKFNEALKRSRKVLLHSKILFIGDSNMHNIGRNKDLQLDTSRQTCVVASGGLCTFAAAHVLKSHEGSYNQVKKVVFSISTNGALHGSDQHCADDREPHIKLLEQEAKRLFPNAKLHFLMPFGGSKGVSNSYVSELREAVANASQMTIHNSPNMDILSCCFAADRYPRIH